MTQAAAHLCAPLLLLAACASDPMHGARAAWAAGDFAQAAAQVRELEQGGGGNVHLWQLERGIAELAVGKPQDSVAALRAARDRLDDLAGKGAGEWFGSVLLDDRQLDFEGYDYEKVLVRAVLAVADLMSGGKDADAYGLQVLETQQRLIESFTDKEGNKPKRAYKLVAFGTYLRAILNEERPTNRDVARQCFEKVVELEPGFAQGQADLERVRTSAHSSKGNGVVHVLAFVGRGPFRVEVPEEASSALIALAQFYYSLHREDTLAIPTSLTAVPIPALAYHPDNPSELHVAVDGKPLATTEVVTDVERTAQAEFEAMKDNYVVRAILRRLFKVVVTETLRDVNYRRNQKDDDTRHLIDFGLFLLGSLWTATEGADLRCWSLLPGTIQVARLELPAGVHELELRPGDTGRPTGQPQRIKLNVRDGFNTYVFALAPTRSHMAPVLCSDPADPQPRL